MAHTPWVRSVVTRLVVVLVLSSLAVSAALVTLEARRTESILALEQTNRLVLSARAMRQALLAVMPTRSADEIQAIVRLFMTDTAAAARVRAGATILTVGNWPSDEALTHAQRWNLNEHALAADRRIPLDRLTIIETQLLADNKPVVLDVLVDGPAVRRQLRQRVLRSFGWHALFLAIATLAGLLLLRRWFTDPLSQILSLVDRNAAAPAFRQVARRSRDEFARLASALGGMLDSLEAAHDEVRNRERAFGHLYEFAPAAMLSLDDAGCIIRANRHAATLLGVEAVESLIGKPVTDFLDEVSRRRFPHAMARLEEEGRIHCELALSLHAGQREVVVQGARVQSSDGSRPVIRLALIDVSNLKALERENADQAGLLRLILDHISDGIVLVDERRRIVAHNRQIEKLLHRSAEELNGAPYDPGALWAPLEIRGWAAFLERLAQIEADDERPAELRAETAQGIFLFRGVPVQDAAARLTGRLWIVEETTAQEQRQRLLVQQTRQLDALKRLGASLESVWTTAALLERTCDELWQGTQAETIGIVVRDPDSLGASRARHLIHCGQGPAALAEHRDLIAAVERGLLPSLIKSGAVTCWQESDRRRRWQGAFERAGLTRLMGRPLGPGDAPLGAIWLARAGTRPIERAHVHLLDAAGPLIAARIELVQRLEELGRMGFLDAVTHLPTAPYLRQWVAAAGQDASSCALIEVHLCTPGRQPTEAMLREAACRLRRFSRMSSLAARVGPASLVILLPQLQADQAQAVLQRLIDVLRPLESANHAIRWRITACPGDAPNAASLIDAALRRATPTANAA